MTSTQTTIIGATHLGEVITVEAVKGGFRVARDGQLHGHGRRYAELADAVAMAVTFVAPTTPFAAERALLGLS